MRRRSRNVCVIGAGAAGLTSIKACLEAGFTVTAYEQTDRVGGLWNINSSSTSCTLTNSSSRMSSFSDFPIPKHWPPFLSRDLVLQYLNDYARHFNLLPHIHFSCMVVKVERSSKEYAVTISNSVTGKTHTSVFDCLMLCIGHHTDPHIPVVTGSQKFAGKILHSKFFDPADYDFAGKTVVVIGSGNSAGDAAVEAGNDVYLAMRSGNHIIKRTTVNGAPVDDVYHRRSMKLMLRFFAPFRSMRNAVLRKINHYIHFDPDSYNIPAVRHGILDRQPIINDQLLPRMLSGRLRVLPIRKIDKFTSDSVVFVQPDESRIAVKCDMVIYATGYRKRSQFIESLIGTEQEFLYRKICPPDNTTIGLIGHVQPLGPQFPLMEMQARYFVFMQNRKPVPLAEANRSIMQDMAESEGKQRDGLTISWSGYMRRLARDMGIEPPIFRLFFTDHKMWRKLFFGPMTPAQYRLFGRQDGKQEYDDGKQVTAGHAF